MLSDVGRRRIATLCGLLCLSCSGERANPNTFRVALLTPGPISDQSWNASAYEGLVRLQDSLGASVSHIQVKSPAEILESFSQYGAQGFSLVIGHGFEFQDAAFEAGKAFPATAYLTTGGSRTSANVAALSFAFEEPSFLAGMAASAVSRSGTIACVGGTELPPVKSAFEAFAAGARTVNPGVRVVTTYLGTWDDAGAGKEQALALIARGADVIFQDADAAGLGVFQAAREAKSVLVVGSNADQNAIAPEVTLGSVVIDVPHAFLLVAREVRGRRFTGRVVRLATRDDVVRWVPNRALAARIPAEKLKMLDAAQRNMTAGTWKPPTAK